MNQFQRSTPSWAAVPTSIQAHRQSEKRRSAPPHSSQFAANVLPLAEVSRSSEAKPAKKTRRRGIVLSDQGWQKLVQAGVVHNQFGERHTYEQLSEQTLLDPRTICRLIGREIGVDKRTLDIFFGTFDLRLEKGDYTTPSEQARGKRQRSAAEFLVPLPASAFSEAQSYSEEVIQLKQQIVENCYRLITLLGSTESSQATLTVQLAPEVSLQLEVNF